MAVCKQAGVPGIPTILCLVVDSQLTLLSLAGARKARWLNIQVCV